MGALGQSGTEVDPPYSRAVVTRLLIVEDDALLRSTLAASLDAGPTSVVAACGSAREAIRIAETEAFDVLVADLDLGGGPNGIVLAHTLRRDSLRIGVVLLTSYADPRIISPKLDRLPPGAQYVRKQDVRDLGHLHDAIERARTRAADPGRGTGPTSGLTRHQLEVMRQVAEGLTNAEIARRGEVTEKAVEVTITRILRQLEIEPSRDRNPRVQITRAYLAMTGGDGGASTAS